MPMVIMETSHGFHFGYIWSISIFSGTVIYDFRTNTWILKPEQGTA
jgi:hypothetical protein